MTAPESKYAELIDRVAAEARRDAQTYTDRKVEDVRYLIDRLTDRISALESEVRQLKHEVRQ